MVNETAVTAGLLLAARIFGQPGHAFDVASVRLDNGAFIPRVSFRIGGGPGPSGPGRFTCKQEPLKLLIAFAFDILPDQLSGPAWLDDIAADRFIITATVPPDTSKERFQFMHTANGMPPGSAPPRVSDKTGLSGIYEFRLEFERMAVTLGTPSVDALDPGAGGRNLFMALEKQLGLKLVRVKGVPVDMVVIDHMDNVPTVN